MLALDEAGFRSYFAGTPVRRAGYESFVRNLIIAAGNSGNSIYINILEKYLQSGNEVMKGAAIWALGVLMPAADFARLRDQYSMADDSAMITAEWQQAP